MLQEMRAWEEHLLDMVGVSQIMTEYLGDKYNRNISVDKLCRHK